MIYHNPILRGFHPDPSICKANDSYYLVNSSFEFLPGLPVYKSNDLINWKSAGFGINKENAEFYPYKGLKNSLGVFAPTIRYHQGKFYIICTFIPKGTFIIQSSNPEKGWSKPCWLDGLNGIDPSLTFIQNECYLQMTDGKGSIILCKINPDTGELLSRVKAISTGTGGRDPEGPHIYYKFNKYWLLLAKGGTREGHMVTMQVADKIKGPYKPVENNPILTNRDYKNELQCVGHADIVQIDEDNYELVSLAVREPKHVHRNLLGRETILLPVKWNSDFIKVNEQNLEGKATLDLNTPISNAPQRLTEDSIDKNDFVGLNQCPNFELVNKSLLWKENTKSKENRNLLGIRQSEFDGNFSFEISADQIQRVGLIVYKDDHHFFKGMYNPAEKEIEFYKQDSDLSLIDKYQLVIDQSYRLKFILSFNKDKYQISIATLQSDFKESFETRHLSCEESDSPFTGTIIGVCRSDNFECKFNNLKLKYR